MNEIDAKVLAAAQDYNRERGKPPALIVVHPEIAKRMTTTCFRFPQLPKLGASAFIQADIDLHDVPPPSSINVVSVEVKILDTSRMEILEYFQSKDRIDCLDEYQVMEVVMRRGKDW